MRKALFFFGVLVSFSILNIYYNSRINKSAETIQNRFNSIAEERAYLERCLNYSFSLERAELSPNTDNTSEFVAYYSGASCFPCLERLLTLLRTEYRLDGKTYVLLDDSSKMYNVEGYNDTFQQQVKAKARFYWDNKRR